MKYMEQITALFLAAMLSLFLLAVDGSGYTAVTALKFRLLAGLTALWLCGLVWCGRKHRVPLSRPDLWEWLVMGYGGLTLLSALWNGVPLLGGSRREGAAAILIYCVIALGVRRFGRWKPWMAHLLGGTMTVWCAVALGQLAGGNPLGLYPAGLTWQDAGVAYSGAYISTTGNTDLAGALLCLVIPALAGVLLRGRDKVRLWLALPLVLCVTVLARMEVRGALLGLLAGGLFALPLMLPVSPTLRRRLLAGAAALTLLGLVLVWAIRLPGTLGEAHDLLHGRSEQYAGAGRVYIWKNCLGLIPDAPLLGCGPDNLGAAGLYFERYDPERNILWHSAIDTAHNEFLNVAVQQGLPALGCFLGAIGLALLNRRRDGTAMTARAGLLCWGVQACFGFSMVNTAPLFWIALALCAPEVSQ